MPLRCSCGMQCDSQVSLVDLIHLYEVRSGAWERYSAKYHSYMDHRFVISNDLRDYMIDTYNLPSKPPISVVHNGVDLSHIDAPASTPSMLHQELALARNVPIIGFVGRLEEQKRPLQWLAVAAMLIAQHPTAHCVMIGTGSMQPQVEAELARCVVERTVSLLLLLCHWCSRLLSDTGLIQRAFTTWASETTLWY
jgi:glycosyltransferase involved in cell wall biosynthesis